MDFKLLHKMVKDWGELIRVAKELDGGIYYPVAINEARSFIGKECTAPWKPSRGIPYLTQNEANWVLKQLGLSPSKE